MSLLSRLAVQAARAYGILSSADKNKVAASYLVVAGGGGGAGGTAGGGGGGAGGYQTSTFTLSTLNTYSIAVGAGGNGGAINTIGSQGSSSVISGTGLTTVTSVGGGYGGYNNVAAGSGGSGGGGGGRSTTNRFGGSATSGQGNAGGDGLNDATNQSGAGGGGAGAVGGNASGSSTGGAGGNGLSSSISGSSVTYAGGGGGAGFFNTAYGTTSNGGLGGTGGGGTANSPGTANLGGGGGGGGGSAGGGGAGAGAAGGSGIVIISYTSATPKFVGGTLTTSGGNQIHTFTSSGTLSPITPVTASYLVVAGGGAGGQYFGGGGGGGGLLTGSTTLYSGATYVVTVGAGGAAAPNSSTLPTNASNSSLSGTGLTTITSIGGGYGAQGGASTTWSSTTGGSGGGGGSTSGQTGGSAGTSGQGNAGGTAIGATQPYTSGGGGGAGAVGSNATSTSGGAGGVGVASSISGTSTYYAGGGGGNGGGTSAQYAGGAGGNGGGGTGGTANSATGVSTVSPISGTANTGGGGGGGTLSGTNNTGAGVSGGSGIVIISYAGSQQFNGGLVTSSGGNTIHTFTATGALTPLTNNLNNSLRFRSSASAYLQRTPTVTGSLTTWTASCWYKNGVMNTNETLFSNAVASDSIGFRSGRVIEIYFGAGSANLVTTQVFRDPAAWYHIVVAVDTTQATAANRIKLYVNGNQVTAFSTATYPSQNYQTSFNRSGYNQEIGRRSSDGSYPIDGYFADINWVDGQALEPYYFGNNDANGVWKPIKYTGTYGTNGFYLTFGNTTSTTTLGYDSSPNGNNWTCNNISLTAGTTYDAMLDVPTNTSATVANYATFNPLKMPAPASVSYTNGNLSVSCATANQTPALTTIYTSSGKWYWEVTWTSGSYARIGVQNTTVASTDFAADTAGWRWESNTGNIYNGSVLSTAPASYSAGDILGFCLDLDSGKLYVSKNGTWQNSAVPASGTGAVATNIPTGTLMSPAVATGSLTSVFAINFGQRPFSYTPPTGFVALNTYNLPTPTILQGNKYMDATLYTGVDSVSGVVVNAGQFKPDLVWAKSRAAAGNHVLADSVRGVNRTLYSNATSAEVNNATELTAFNSNGFSFGTSGDWSNGTHVGWQWQAGAGTTSTNTSGSISSTVSVNTTAGFSVVTFTGTQTTATIGHGLGVAPKMIISKNRNDGATSWRVYHVAIGAGNYLNLNSTSASTAGTGVWGNTTPTSTVYYVNNDGGTNGSGQAMVAYCWAEIAGFSKFGSYTGNGSADGSFIYTGFQPAFILIKVSSTADEWVIFDNKRPAYNLTNLRLNPNSSSAEQTTQSIDILSNGFKARSTGANINGSGATYIYAAFAAYPFKNSNSF